jgi:hypothetical protein
MNLAHIREYLAMSGAVHFSLILPLKFQYLSVSNFQWRNAVVNTTSVESSDQTRVTCAFRGELTGFADVYICPGTSDGRWIARVSTSSLLIYLTIKIIIRYDRASSTLHFKSFAVILLSVACDYMSNIVIRWNINGVPRRKIKYGVGRPVAQAVSRRLLTATARVRAQVRSCGVCGGQSGTGAGFLRVLRFPLPVLIPPTAPRSSSITRGCYNRTVSGRRTKLTQSHPTPRNIKKLKNRKVWILPGGLTKFLVSVSDFCCNNPTHPGP